MAVRTRAAAGRATRTATRRILVVGAARATGLRLVTRLAADPTVARVLALDDKAPDGPLPDRVDFVPGRPRSSPVLRLLRSERVDTIVHLGLTAEPAAAGGRGRMKDRNVIDTMQLLAAAQHAPNLERLVLKSTTAVYGSGPTDPAVWIETMTPAAAPRFGFGRDAVEVEGYVRGFSRRTPGVAVTVLRLANQVGPSVDNPLTRYFALPVLPCVLGFDPRLQFLHETDADEVLARAVLRGAAHGTFNVAGQGVVPLTQAARIAGRPTLPIPQSLVGLASELLRSSLDFSPEQVRFLHYGRVADTGHARTRLRFTPRFSSIEAFTDFARARLSPLLSPDRAAALEHSALELLDRVASLIPGGRGEAAGPHSAPRTACAATTTAGARCRNRAGPDGRCSVHRRRGVAGDGDETQRDGRHRDGTHGDGLAATASVLAVQQWLVTPVRRELPGEAGGAAAASLSRAGAVLEFLRRRLTGDYLIDEFGHDPDLVDHLYAPALRPLYRRWFRVATRGVGNVPPDGGAVVVGNHGGALPLDALMVRLALHDEHPQHRPLRMLAADLAFTLPVIAPITRRAGGTLACDEDAERLLGKGELIGIWPEGYKGLGKPFRQRYQLQRFGRGGFVEVALRFGAPIVPVCVVGAEEAYPIVADARPVARLLGLPYLPITPTFPLLGPLGAIPLPTKWTIEFCRPIPTAQYGRHAAHDPMIVFELTDVVRDVMRTTLHRMLLERPGVFG